MMLLHGAGDLGALGIPLPLLLVLAAATVPALSGALSARAEGMQSRPAPRYRPLPGPLRALLDSRIVRAAGGTAALALLLGVLLIAALGPEGRTGNPAPRLALVMLWGAVAIASVLLGPVWRAVSPFRLLARAVARATGADEESAVPLPESVGLWPAVTFLALWAWLAEALPAPRAVAMGLLVYTAAQVLAGLRYGQAWFARGEAVEALSTALASIAPIGRDAAGRLGVRNPLAALARAQPAPGSRALLAVLLAWELAHAFRGTDFWPLLLADLGLRRGAATSTAVYLLALLVAAVAVRAATPRPFLVPALVPMAAGWLLAHHVGPVRFDWRAAFADLADPLGLGWSLHGVTPPPIMPVAPGPVALAQLLLLVAGALLAVVAAHRAAVARFDLRAARAVQFPLRVVLIAAVLAAVALQSAAAV